VKTILQAVAVLKVVAGVAEYLTCWNGQNGYAEW
jgi:hypothetical protein